MKSLATWCDQEAILLLSELSLCNLEQYRKTWTGAPISRRKRQERLRSFYHYCMRHRWVTENIATNLSNVKTTDPPTMPLTRVEFERVLKCATQYNPRSTDREWRRRRATAMLLLLRWSGLRLGDAARLERTSLDASGNLWLYTSKTGEVVYIPLPNQAVKALRALESPNPRYFFWNGTSTKESAVVRWWGTIKSIFRGRGSLRHTRTCYVTPSPSNACWRACLSTKSVFCSATAALRSRKDTTHHGSGRGSSN